MSILLLRSYKVPECLLAVTFPLDEYYFLGPFSAIFQDLFYVVPLPGVYLHLLNLLGIEPTFYLFLEHVLHLIPSYVTGCLDCENFLTPVGFVASIEGFPLFQNSDFGSWIQKRLLLSLIQVDLLVQAIKQSVRVGWVDVHRSACESSVKSVIVRVYHVLQHIYIIAGLGVIQILPHLSLKGGVHSFG